MSIYLSLFFGFHDSTATFADENGVLLHLEAERIFRKKHMKTNLSQMEQLVELGLNYLDVQIGMVDTLFVCKWGCEQSDTVTFCGKQFHPIWTSHHANHIGMCSQLGWKDGVAICADGGSENGYSSVYYYKDQSYTLAADLDDSLLTGTFYGTLTQLIIDEDFHAAHVHFPGKTMGLHSHGELIPGYEQFILENQEEFKKLHVGGVASLKAKMAKYRIELFSLKDKMNFAHTAQKLWEKLWLSMIKQHTDHSSNLLFSGGCALNVALNEQIRISSGFSEMYVPPVASDCGQSIGALMHRLKIPCDFPYLGRGKKQMERLNPQAVEDLLNGKILFWFNGRSEAGPRALGHRSIIGLPNTIQQRIKLSEQIKKREFYRPVAPIVLEEDKEEWFELDAASPYMTFAPKARKITKDKAPAIVHVDGTSRVQTVNKSQDPILHELLQKLKEATDVPIVMNTSMNLPGEPICDTEEDAKLAFKKSGADVLYLNNLRFE